MGADSGWSRRPGNLQRHSVPAFQAAVQRSCHRDRFKLMARTPSRRSTAGFTLTELAIVTMIVSLLLASLMYTLAAQTEQRNMDDTRRRLEQARDLVLAFALVNGRLPCPARYTSSASNSSGLESFCTAGTGTCVNTETTTVQSHGNCSNY